MTNGKHLPGICFTKIYAALVKKHRNSVTICISEIIRYMESFKNRVKVLHKSFHAIKKGALFDTP
jgi:hypothetical protein